MAVGDVVVAEDAEGTRCRARVAKIDKGVSTVAHLSLEGGAVEAPTTATG